MDRVNILCIFTLPCDRSVDHHILTPELTPKLDTICYLRPAISLGHIRRQKQSLCRAPIYLEMGLPLCTTPLPLWIMNEVWSCLYTIKVSSCVSLLDAHMSSCSQLLFSRVHNANWTTCHKLFSLLTSI